MDVGLKFVAVQAQGTLMSAPSWTSQVLSSITATGGEVTTLLLGILTIGLGIFALQWGVKKAMRFFKSTTN